MKLLADLHTHSKYSGPFHAKDTIEQMAYAANEQGLVEVAITDHGYNHWCGTSLYKIAKARLEIDEINKWSKTKVLLGVEADIISEDGKLDIDEDTLQIIDVLVVGYHRLIKTDFVNYFGFQKKTKEAKEKATNAFINAINKYPVTIVSHLDSILTTDLYRIGKACADKGVMVEINNRHCKWTEEQVNELIASGCLFVVSSDAHRSEDVGNVSRALAIVKKYNIPLDMIANIQLEDFEKTDQDVELEEYYSLYLAKKKEKEEKEAALAEKKKTQFTNSLSEEMESKLREIAKEKGLHYEEVQEEDDLTEEYQRFRATYAETEELIKQAKDFLNQNALGEFDAQNTKVDADNEFIIEQLNDGLEDVVETKDVVEEEPTKVEVQPVEEKPQEPLKEETQGDDEKVLSVMQKTDTAAAKPMTAAAKPASKTSQKGVEIVKNTSIPKTAGATKRNGQSIESFMSSLKNEEKEETVVEEKPKPKTVQKNKTGGVFIQINDLNDDKK